jgi:hypothetical protein
VILITKELSIDYLKAFHKFVSSHPHIYGAVKEEIHKRARGSAGGQIKARKASEVQGDDLELEDLALHLDADASPVKAINAAPMGKVLAEDEDTITVEVFPIKEGVYSDVLNGIPILKKYEEFAPYVHWLDGVPITNDHVYPKEPEVTHRTPKPGKLLNTGLDPENRRARSEGRYFKKSLLPDQLDRLKNGIPHDGSIEYMCGFKDESGEFEGKHYDRVEVGPYYFYNYAEVPRGACSVSDGCGIQANAASDDNVGHSLNAAEDLLAAAPSLELVDGNVRKRCPKQLNEAKQMAEDIEALKAEFTKQLNAATEMITSLKGTISELTTKIGTLEDSHKQLNAAFDGKVAAETEAKTAAFKAEFKKSLNAAASTEADALWDQAKGLNPVEYESWKQTNAGKLQTEVEKKEAKGRKQTNAGGWDLAAEQAKVWGY